MKILWLIKDSIIRKRSNKKKKQIIGNNFNEKYILKVIKNIYTIMEWTRIKKIRLIPTDSDRTEKDRRIPLGKT